MHRGLADPDATYDPRKLRLRIRDDGKGIDPRILDEGGRTGHHGLPGMQERAKLAGGKLAIWSELDSGSEIELTVPGAIAYDKPGAPGSPPNNIRCPPKSPPDAAPIVAR